MTKSKGIGRGAGGGGPQPGAGRPRKAGADVLTAGKSGTASVEAGLQEQPPPPRRRVIRSAKPLLAKAYATLESVMDSSPSPAARVSAARTVIELAKAEALDAAAYSPAPRGRYSTADWDGLLGGKT